MKSRRDGILVAARNLSQLNSSFRSDINLPPINGLAKSLGAREIYKYLVPTGLAEYKRILLSSNFGAKVLLECFDKAPMNFIHFFVA